MKHEPEVAWSQETNQDFEMTLEERINYSMKAPECRLYDVLTVLHDSEGNPLNLSAERECLTEDELHARVMAKLAPEYRRSVLNPYRGGGVFCVLTYDERGVLFELVKIGRA